MFFLIGYAFTYYSHIFRMTSFPPEPEVPYYVDVVAVNSIGVGDAQSVVAFTKEGSKSRYIIHVS